MGALAQVTAWPVATAAAGVVVAGDDGPPATVGPTGRPFPWASVTKPVTALAVLVAVEEGTLSLDEPAGPPGSTVRHLLAHASGLAPDERRAVAPPGTARIYSNAGYDVLAEVLAARAGMPFTGYVAEGVLAPLAMGTARFAPLGGDGPAGAGGGTATPGPAAAGLAGSLDDLLGLARELLAPTLLAPATLAEATSVAFPGLAGVLPGFGRFDPCDWGLGVEVRGGKRPHWTGTANSAVTFGHFGRAGSFVWVDPVAGVACAGLADRPFGPWAARAWPALADGVLAEVAASPPGSAPPPRLGSGR